MKLFLAIFMCLFSIQITQAQTVFLVDDYTPGSESTFEFDAQIIGTAGDAVIITQEKLNVRTLYRASKDGGIEVLLDMGIDGFVVDYQQDNDAFYVSTANSDGNNTLWQVTATEVNELYSSEEVISQLLLYNNFLFFNNEYADFEDGFFYYDPETGDVVREFNVDWFGGVRDVVVFNDNIYMIVWLDGGAWLARTDGSEVPEKIFYFHDGNDFSRNVFMTVAGDHMYFWYNDGNYNYTFFRSDGTEAGTEIINKEYEPLNFYEFQNRRAIYVYEDKLFFRAQERAEIGNNEGLFVIDGSMSSPLKIILDPNQAVKPEFFTEFNDQLYCYVHYDEGFFFPQRGMYITDGTQNGTVKALNESQIGEGYFSDGRDMWAFGDSLYYTAYSDPHLSELWVTDGTESGTRRVTDINPGDESSTPTELQDAGGKLYFFAENSEFGRELWVLDYILSSDEDIIAEDFKVYPNPNPGNLLNIGLEYQDGGRMMVFSSMGRLMMNTGTDQLSNGQLDVSHLPTGHYILLIHHNDNSLNRASFTIQR